LTGFIRKQVKVHFCYAKVNFLLLYFLSLLAVRKKVKPGRRIVMPSFIEQEKILQSLSHNK